MNLTDINGGIRLINSSNNKIYHNNILKNSIGITLENSSNNNVNYNILLLSRNGINIENSSVNNSFHNNSIPFCNFGISISSSSDNSFSTNLLFFNLKGIILTNSPNNKIEDNYISASIMRGIHLVNSPANIIINNSFSYHGGITITSGHSNVSRGDISQTIEGNIITDNITDIENGTSIYYYYQEDGVTVPGDAGQVILDKCTNFVLQGLNLSNTDNGIQLISTSNTIISNCAISKNSNGIQLFDSSDNIISNCTIFNNTYGGINFHDSPFNIITDNNFINDGIVMGGELQYLLNRSREITPSLNWTTQTITNNTVNGKPLYYYSNQNGFTVPSDAGQIILANCSNFVVENTNISMMEFGIQLGYSSDNVILQNNISNCSVGLSILYASNNNEIYHNHFINNSLNAYDNCSNIWDNGSLFGGNYWDDYGGIDKNGDGIGDTPYNISGGSTQDRYPLGYFTNNVPVANFTYSPTSPTTADVIQFNDTSVDIDGSIYSWFWDFGDGNTSIHPNPSHQYTDDGTYTMNLTVIDEHDVSNSTEKILVVTNMPPFADFLFGPLNPIVNDTIYFSDFSFDLDGFIINWTWDFGDGNFSYEQNSTYQYISAGNYTVTLIVTDDDGEIDSISKFISIGTLLEGYCYYPDMTPVNNLTVDVINLDTGHRWQADIINHYYSLSLVPDEDVNANDTLRLIARDNMSYVNVTSHIISQEEINMGRIYVEMILDEYCLDLKDFPMYLAQDIGGYTFEQMTGPAVSQMNLNYMWWNSTQDPGGVPIPGQFDDQEYLFNYSAAGEQYMDADAMHATIQELDPSFYNFGIYHNADPNEIIADICYWIDYDVPGAEPGYPSHVPGAVPAYGNYSNWMSIRGIHTNHSVYGNPDALTVHGLWVNDPLPSGIGKNTYKMASEWLSTYYFDLDVPGDPYNNEYVAVCEPPEDAVSSVELVETTHYWDMVFPEPQGGAGFLNQIFDSLIIYAATTGARDRVCPYDDRFSAVFDQSHPGRPMLVKNLVIGDEKHDFYIVPYNNEPTGFMKKGSHSQGDEEKTLVAVIVNAKTGQFQEASWVEEPVKYLKISESDAREIVYDTLVDMGINPDELNIREIQTSLVYRGSTPYYPDWQVIISELGLTFFVSQDGTIN